MQSKVTPQVTSLHIACRYGHLETVKALSMNADLNKQDQVTIRSADLLSAPFNHPRWHVQWGFTALHYATVARSKEVVLYLLANGASAIMTSAVSEVFPVATRPGLLRPHLLFVIH
jgi:ankyrin repeat protein